MTRLKIHLIDESGLNQAAIADKSGTSIRTVQRVLTEHIPSAGEVAAGRLDGSKRIGRPMKATQEMLDKIVELLDDNSDIPSTEVLRRSREWGYDGGRSQMLDLVKKLRPLPKHEPVIRFEGLPGEYTQFDFGESLVLLEDESRLKVAFFAARLKYSRFMSVTVVSDQTAETVVRSILISLQAFGGSSKEWVFDNPRTIRISPVGVQPVVLHRFLQQLVAEYRVIPTFCAPRSGNQKGSVERLVGFVKNSFLRVRKFRDLADVKAQLTEWLRGVNEDRPSDATGVIPAVALVEEAPCLAQRPLQTPIEAWAITETATVSPMGTVSYKGTRYFVTARCLGTSATVLVRRNTLEFRVGDERCEHPREDGTGEVRRHPYQRDEVEKVLHGARKGSTFRRQCLVELGKPAVEFLTGLVHLCDDWTGPCNELYALLGQHGDGAMRDAMIRCTARKTFSVAAIRVVIKAAA
jgi:transposase